jgi:hypothetical protein
MLITATDPQQPKPSKIILSTNQGYQISQLIREYIEVVFEQQHTHQPGQGKSQDQDETVNC